MDTGPKGARILGHGNENAADLPRAGPKGPRILGHGKKKPRIRRHGEPAPPIHRRVWFRSTRTGDPERERVG